MVTKAHSAISEGVPLRSRVLRLDAWTWSLAALGCALVGSLAVYVRLWLNRPRTNIPGPAEVPLLGNVLYFRKLPVRMEHFRELQRRYGNVFRIYAGPKLVVVVTQPAEAKRFMVGVKMRSRDDFAVTPLKPFTRNGLLTSKGEIWKERRRLIEPTFHAEIVSEFMDHFNEGAKTMCQKLAETEGYEVEMTKIITQTVLGTITSSIFGKSIDKVEPDKQRQDELASVFVEALKLMQKRLYRPWLLNEWILSLLPEGRILRRQTSLVNDTVNRMVTAMRKRSSVQRKRKKSFLDVMVDSNGNLLLPEDDVIDEVLSLAIAGTETTAITMGFMFALLGLHPEWQEAIWKEVDDVYKVGGDYYRPSTESDLANFKIMEAFLKETLRLYPPLPNAPVSAEEDIRLSGSGYLVPRGTLVLVSLVLLHRQPDAFPLPDRFDPGRFLGGADPPPACAYLPFGAGARKCMGQRYALLEVKTLFAAVLRRFRILPGSSRQDLDQVRLSLSGTPVTSYRITCVPRSDTSVTDCTR